MQADYVTDEYGDEHKTEKRVVNFNITDAALAQLAEKHKDVDAYKDMERAKKAKRECVKLRSKLTERHKEEKAEALAYGRMLDAEKRRIMEKIAEVEDPITQQLDDIKNEEKRKEEERVAGIEAKIATIEALATDRQVLSLDELKQRYVELEAITVTADDYQEFTDRANSVWEDTELKLRVAMNRERERLEEEARLEKQRQEQEAEAEKLRAEREAIEAEKAKIAKAEEERQAKIRAEEQERQAKLAAELAERKRKIDEENARLARIAAEEEAERQRQEAEALRLAQAPDAEKLEVYANRVDALLADKPELTTDAGKAAFLEAEAALVEVAFELRAHAGDMK